MQELAGLITNAPVAAAVIVAVRMMLKAQQEERNAMREEMQAEREELHSIIKEDLRELTEAVKAMTIAVSQCNRG